MGSGAQVTVLGSGTLIPSASRHSTCIHVGFGEASVLLDCGSGTLHGLALHGIRWPELTHIVVSHYHLDHVGDLAAILFALKHGPTSVRTRPLTLIGPPGFASYLERLAAACGSHVLDPGLELAVIEVSQRAPIVDSDHGLTLTSTDTPHTEESVAYRLETEWGGIGYTGDTGLSEEVATFLSGCRLLLAECAYDDPPPFDLHLSPKRLAHMASIARPDLLVVTHVYPPQAPDRAVARVAERYDGAVLPARDGLRLRVTEDGVTVDPG